MVLMGLLAETFIHPGAGQTSGVVDLPVSREAATGYPYIPGSGVKGAMREAFIAAVGDDTDNLFGHSEAAGEILISDARLLLLPVRSLNGVYKWVTCPHLLERFARDRDRAGASVGIQVPNVDRSKFLAPSEQEDKKIFLEERSFRAGSAEKGQEVDNWAKEISHLIDNDAVCQRLHTQLAVLSDDDFAWFARYGLSVQARNVLDKSKRSQNLWYEETLPPDTLMYSMLARRNPQSEGIYALEAFFDDQAWLQVGGNETVGQGWFRVKWWENNTG